MRRAFRHKISQRKSERPAEIHKLLLDLAPRDFHLFLHLKKCLAGNEFDDDDEVQGEVMTWFKGLAADFYDSGMQKLVPGFNKCLDNAGDCVGK